MRETIESHEYCSKLYREPVISPPGAVITWMQTYADWLAMTVRTRRLASFSVFAGRAFIDASLAASVPEAANSTSLLT